MSLFRYPRDQRADGEPNRHAGRPWPRPLVPFSRSPEPASAAAARFSFDRPPAAEWKHDSRPRVIGLPSGVALMDAPNIRCVLHGELGRAPYGDRDLDLKRLRAWHKHVLLIRKCHFVVRPDPSKRRVGLRDAVRRGSWRWVRCEKARYGYNEDPVDDYIIHRLVELTEQFDIHQQNTISLISHDGGFAPYLERFVEAGGYVAILGILDRMSKHLWELARRERVVLFDLNQDIHAVRRVEADGECSPLAALG